MNDREMLDRLEWSGDSRGTRCPDCWSSKDDGHCLLCPLGNHLHPELAQGSAAWAEVQRKAVYRRCWGEAKFIKPSGTRWLGKQGQHSASPIQIGGDDWELYEPEPAYGSPEWRDAQARAGKEVRRSCWPSTRRWFLRDGRWLTVMDGECPVDPNYPPTPEHDWELYEPAPKEGSPEWADAQGRSGEWVEGESNGSVLAARKFYDGEWWYRDSGKKVLFTPMEFATRFVWRIAEPSKSEPPERVRLKLEWREGLLRYAGPDNWGTALELSTSDVDGYRFNAWVYNLPTGYEMRCPAGKIPMYWDETQGMTADIPGGGLTPIWPQEVEMIRVEGAE